MPPGLPGRSLLALAAGAHRARRPRRYFEALSAQLNRGWAPLYGLIHEGVKYIDLPCPSCTTSRATPREAHEPPGGPQRAAALRARGAPRRGRGGGASGRGRATRERLRSLGYAAGGAPAKERYTAADDPKTLIALDALMQDVAALSLAGDVDGARARCLELLRRRPDTPVALLQLGPARARRAAT